jgi:hypothetical protein
MLEKPLALGEHLVSVVTCLPHISRHQQSSSATLRDESQGALSFIRRHKVNLLTCNILFSGMTRCGKNVALQENRPFRTLAKSGPERARLRATGARVDLASTEPVTPNRL